MNNYSLLAAQAKKVQAAGLVSSLPMILEDAAISDVIAEEVIDKVSDKAILVDGKPILTAHSILSVHFRSLKVTRFVCFVYCGS
jgi:hypothetical protein